MIDLSNNIQELLINENCHKYFFVHFPFDDYDDINNSQIISESFKLTESICSKNVVEFGICEASQITMDIYGIPNITGCIIQVYMKIDSYTEKINLGTFKVDSAKSKSGLQNARTIVAYSKVAFQDLTDEYDYNIIDQKKSFWQDRNLSDIQIKLIEHLIEGNFIEPTTIRGSVIQPTSSSQFKLYSSQTKDTRFTVYIDYYQYKLDSSDISFDSLYKLYDYKFDGLMKLLQNAVEYYNTTYKDYPIEYDTYMSEKSFIHDIYSHLLPRYYGYKQSGDVTCYIYPKEDVRYVYPVVMTDQTSYTIIIPYKFTFSATIKDGDIYTVDDIITDYRYATGNFMRLNLMEFVNVILYYKDPMDIKLKSLAESYFKLNGAFCKIDRDTGCTKLMRPGLLTRLYPKYNIYPSDSLYPEKSCDFVITENMYSDVNIDELVPISYGKVCCSYYDFNGNKNYYSYVIDSENSTKLDVSKNEIILKGKFTKQSIASLMGQLVNGIKAMSYFKMKINCIGLPFLEAGDTIFVETKDGGFLSIIMSRTLSGCQRLKDSYEAN